MGDGRNITSMVDCGPYFFPCPAGDGLVPGLSDEGLNGAAVNGIKSRQDLL